MWTPVQYQTRGFQCQGRCVAKSSSPPTNVDDPYNLSNLLRNRPGWMLSDPSAPITHIHSNKTSSFKILRDDLLHPYVAGNKRRKLDALFPSLLSQGVKDVITLGGVQSAHIAAVASAAAEQGLRAHILVRGEQPRTPPGNYVLVNMFAYKVVHRTRAEYANRTVMLEKYIESQFENNDSFAVISEGASLHVEAMLGYLRVIDWLISKLLTDDHRPHTFIIDSGTGASAISLALGCWAAKRKHWKVVGVMLAGSRDYYEAQTRELVTLFCQKQEIYEDTKSVIAAVSERIEWVDRRVPRKFGNVRPGEIEACRSIAQEYGILLDPIWTLAAWEAAVDYADSIQGAEEVVMMIHTGGSAGALDGLAQRFPQRFSVF